MAEVSDILLDSDNDIVIVNGDLDVGLSDNMHIEHILRAKPGNFYQWPTLGVGVLDLQLGPGQEVTLRQRGFTRE